MPFDWAATDTVYGVGAIEMQLRRAGKGDVLGAHATDPFNSWGKTLPVAGPAEPIARALASQAWRRLSAGDGTKGPRRQHANRLTSPQKRNDEARLQRWYAGLSRTSAGSPHASPSAGSSLLS